MPINFSVLRIAIPSPLRRLFDYLPPAHCELANLKPGMRVQVPFGNHREVIGILMEVTQDTRIAPAKLKTAIAILDILPIWPGSLLNLGQWASAYYKHPIGDVLIGILPKHLRLRAEPLDFSQALSQEAFGPPVDDQQGEVPAYELNAHQVEAISAVTSSAGFGVFLLEGVTGSGKTEVYLQIIAHQLQQGKQALVLVPEIALTPQIVSRFEARFTVPIVVLHSGLNDKHRAKAWLQAHQHSAAIIIGTRSAIFTPLAQPGVIILDEEHDASFKQQTGFRYSARDVAVMRGKLENIPVILGSATPSFESLYNADRGRYHRLSLPNRAGLACSPSYHLLDMRGLSLSHGLSATLLGLIRQHLDQKRQVLLFLNRRGYSPVLLCHDCAWTASCKACDAKLTLHQSPRRLQCHHCEAIYAVPVHCEQCKSKGLITVGLGTERLEEGLLQYFPGTEVLRMDSDTTQGKGQLKKLLDKIQAGEPCIITGTQMLAKGHHFPNVTMVAVVDADSGLYSTDFRAGERMAQLIVQVAGRAGRGDTPGQVIIQSHNPQHPLLQSLISQGYPHFAVQERKERQATALPPYAYLAILRAEASSQASVQTFLNSLRREAEGFIDVDRIKMLGPIASVMERKAGRFRAQLLFQAKNRNPLQKFLSQLIDSIETAKPSRKIRWAIDVDPIEVL